MRIAPPGHPGAFALEAVSYTHLLELRVERHSESALKVAKFLREHAAVADVFYPGLAGTAGAEIAAMSTSRRLGLAGVSK